MKQHRKISGASYVADKRMVYNQKRVETFVMDKMILYDPKMLEAFLMDKTMICDEGKAKLLTNL